MPRPKEGIQKNPQGPNFWKFYDLMHEISLDLDSSVLGSLISGLHLLQSKLNLLV